MFIGERDGTFFLQCRFRFSNELSLQKTPCNKICHSRHIYLSPSSIGLLRLQVPSLSCIFLLKNIPRFHEGYVFIKLVPEMGLFLQNVVPVHSDADTRTSELLATKRAFGHVFPSSLFELGGVATASSPII